MLVSALAEVSARRRELRDVPLRCWDARALVGDYLDGELDDGARRLVDAHLRTCPTCPPLVAALVGAERALGTLADRDRDPDRVLAPELLRRIEARHRGEVLNSDESAGR
jgi:RNA polymerase sigma-70 factor (ECF subfamily)